QGYLNTWPATRALQDAELAPMEGMLEHEAYDVAARIERGAPAELQSHLGLTLVSRALGRIAFATGRLEIADRGDAILLRQFGRDQAWIEAVVRERLAFGYADSASEFASKATGLTPETRSKLDALLAEHPRERWLSFEDVLAEAHRTGSY